MPEVNKDRVRLLVDALRSGRFLQGNGGLEMTGSKTPPNPVVTHCCLGVACRVAMEHGLEVKTHHHGGDFYQTEFEGVTGYMPENVRAWYGFPEMRAGNERSGHNVPLLVSRASWVGTSYASDQPNFYNLGAASINDDGRFDFSFIADAFERTYLVESGRDEGAEVQL